MNRTMEPNTPLPFASAARRMVARLRVAACALALCAALSGCGRGAGSPMAARSVPAITVSTWNIRWFPSGTPDAQPEIVEREIIEEAGSQLYAVVPHILCAQELRDPAAATNLAAAARLEGLRVAVCTDFPLAPDGVGTQQVAIFSRYPVLACGAEPWASTAELALPRGFAWALLDTPQGPLAVFSVHLKSNYIPEGLDRDAERVLNGRRRSESVRQLCERIPALLVEHGRENAAVLVAGDFNSALGDGRFADETTFGQLFEAGFTCLYGDNPGDFPVTIGSSGTQGEATFDYFFARGLTCSVPPKSRRKSWVSDHRLVVAKVRLAQGE